MAYPMKRRKLSPIAEQSTLSEKPIGQATHGLQEITALSRSVQRTPLLLDEVHARVRKHQASKRSHNEHEAAHLSRHRRRAGTSINTLSDLESVSTSMAPTAAIQSTTVASTIIDSLAITRPSEASVSISIGTDGIITPITTWLLTSAVSGSDPTQSSDLSLTTATVVPSNTDDGMIGIGSVVTSILATLVVTTDVITVAATGEPTQIPVLPTLATSSVSTTAATSLSTEVPAVLVTSSVPSNTATSAVTDLSTTEINTATASMATIPPSMASSSSTTTVASLPSISAATTTDTSVSSISSALTNTTISSTAIGTAVTFATGLPTGILAGVPTTANATDTASSASTPITTDIPTLPPLTPNTPVPSGPSPSVNATVTDPTLLSSMASLTATAASSTVTNATINSNITATDVTPSAISTLTAFSNTVNLTASLTSTSTGPSGILGLFGVVVSTMPDGRVTSIPASRSASVTTQSDGSRLTIFGSLVPVTAVLSSPSATSDLGSSTSDSLPTETGVNGSSSQPGITATGSSVASPTASSSSSTNSSSTTNDDAMPAPQILAGGIVGGVAGIAVILLAALFFIRLYRRRSNMQSLDTGDRAITDSSRGMSERTGFLPFTAAAAGLLALGRKKDRAAPANEPSFQKVAGRKLPSAFSAGMGGPANPGSPPPVPMPAAFEHDSRNRDRDNPTSYRDTAGYYHDAGHGESSSAGSSPIEGGLLPDIQPGPARQATIHQGGSYGVGQDPFGTPPGSPRMPMLEGRSATPMNLDPFDAYHPARSETPHSHNSRFIEQV